MVPSRQTADKPFSAAAERNSGPILEVLHEHFADRRRVLEIGSGTGQHAVCFAAALSHLDWQPSDRDENLPGICRWCDAAGLPNLRPPLMLDVNLARDWSTVRAACGAVEGYDAVYSANTLHIMSWAEVETLFQHLPAVAAADALLAVYGPFKRGGQHTSASNAAFERSLQASDSRRAIRDLEAVDALAQQAGFARVDDRALPANNACIVWRRG